MKKILQINKIYHGNCFDIIKNMPNESIDIILTDPPYGDNINYGRLNRGITNNENPLVCLLMLANTYRILKDNSVSYTFCGMKHIPIIDLFINKYTDYKIAEIIVWNKINFGMGFSFRHQHELIIVLEKGNPIYKDKSTSNILNEKRIISDLHPHEKPISILKKLILHSSNKGDLIFDPFAGSGTLAIACLYSKRNYILIEQEKKYIDIINKRIREEIKQNRFTF